MRHGKKISGCQEVALQLVLQSFFEKESTVMRSSIDVEEQLGMTIQFI